MRWSAALALALAASLGTLTAGEGAAAPRALLIVDETGAPVVGADVEVLAAPRTSSPLSALSSVVLRDTTGADGRVAARVPDLPELTVLVDHPDFAPLRATLPVPASTLTLGKGRRLVGRLADVAGSPLRAATGRACARWTIRLEPWRSRRDRERCVGLEDADRFELRGLPGERVEVTVEVPGFLPTRASGDPLAAETLVLEVRPGVLLAGEIVDPRGRPVAGATVEADVSQARELASSRFELAVTALPAVLAVNAPGFRPRTVRVTKAVEAKALRIVLDAGEQIRGSASSESGEPIGEIKLGLERFEPPSAWTLDEHQLEPEDGAFRLDLPGPGEYRARLRVDGHRPVDVPPFRVDAGESHDLGTVVLGRGAGVEGRLVDPRTGQGLAGADVRLLAVGTAAVEVLRRGEGKRTTSDDGGRFLIAGLDSGRFELRVRRTGSAELVRVVELERDRVSDLGDLALGPGALVGGEVVDRAGEPLAGAEVRFLSASAEVLEPLAVWSTDGRGTFRGDRFAAGDYRVEVHRERPLLGQQVAIGAAEEDVALELVVSTVELHGVVLRDGEPVGGGVLTISSDLDSAWQQGKVLIHTQGSLDAATVSLGLPGTLVDAAVAADGTFVVEDAPAGPVAATYYPPAGAAVGRRLLVEDRPRVWVEIELAGSTLTGRVVDAESEAGIAARIKLFDAAGRLAREAESAGDGSFRIGDLDGGPFLLEAAAEGFATVTRPEVRPGAEPIVVALEPGDAGALDLQLVRSDGSPAAGAQVNLLSSAGRMVRSLLADPSGARRYEGLPAGSYFVVWKDSLGGVGASEEIVVAHGETRRVDLEVARGAPLTLSCPSGSCGGGTLDQVALYTAHGLEVGAFLRTTAGPVRIVPDGSLILGHLAPGRYLLRVWRNGGPQDRIVEISAGGAIVAL